MVTKGREFNSRRNANGMNGLVLIAVGGSAYKREVQNSSEFKSGTHRSLKNHKAQYEYDSSQGGRGVAY